MTTTFLSIDQRITNFSIRIVSLVFYGSATYRRTRLWRGRNLSKIGRAGMSTLNNVITFIAIDSDFLNLFIFEMIQQMLVLFFGNIEPSTTSSTLELGQIITILQYSAIVSLVVIPCFLKCTPTSSAVYMNVPSLVHWILQDLPSKCIIVVLNRCRASLLVSDLL